jgi:NAD(P)H dehydrogenase (quinone)
MTIAITGASGQLAQATAGYLLDRIPPTDLVLVTRRPEALEAFARRGVDVRAGDFDDPAGLREALAGVDRALLISTDALGRRIPQHRDAVHAARAAGVGHLLYTSIPNPTDANPAGVVPDHKATEEAIVASEGAWTFLRNDIYADLQLPGIEQAAASGRHVHNEGDGALAYVARDDLAAAAAAVLATDGHEYRAYDLTGPELLTAADVADIAAELRGSAVEAIAVDDDAFAAGLVEHAGLPEEAAALYTSFGRAKRYGQLDQLTPHVRDLIGRPPRTLRDLAREALAPAAT